MNTTSVLRQMLIGGTQATALRDLPSRPATTAAVPAWLPEPLPSRLVRANIHSLYAHQADAIARVEHAQHVVVATGTASGKSLCYQLPILANAIRDPQATALYLSPTKALARDQLRHLRAFTIPHARAAVYDGDTPTADREAVRNTANVILTNPDMLHIGILPAHRRWQEFLRHLRIVVVDECHVARGVFGSHVAAVLRRLLRVTDHYGAAPVFILSSATIGNPAAHAHALTGLNVVAVERDGSPKPNRTVALWSPPVTDQGQRSTLSEAADMLAEMVRAGAATLAFVKSRKAAEVIAVAARRRLGSDAANSTILAYRAGLLPQERRQVERGLVDGSIRGVATTDALELGMDVGGLDAVIIAGWPGTFASLWQQAGRAGRRDSDAAIVFIADDDPLDRYLLQHPDEVFSRPLEHAVTDVANPYVAAAHLRCAAAELPLDEREDRLADMNLTELIDAEVTAGGLRLRGDRWYYAGSRHPAPSVSLRTVGGTPVRIVAAESGVLIGEVDRPRAPKTVHDGAVYLHQGRSWRVQHLDMGDDIALVHPDDGTTTTSTRTDTDIQILQLRDTRSWQAAALAYGDVVVTTHVEAYERRDIFTGASLGVTALDMEPTSLTTHAMWLTIPSSNLSALGPGALASDVLPGAAHAAEHAAIGLLPLFAMCDRWDIGGVSTVHHRDTGALTIFIYDGYPGGAGIAERGFATDEGLWLATRDAIATCPCADGCPSCIQSPKCGNGNNPLHKHGAVALLDVALSLTPPVS